MTSHQGDNVAIAGPAALASFFANGYLAQTAQILLLRELLVVLDGDEFALGIVLAAWLCFAALGALIARQKRDARPPLAGFAILIALTVCSLPVSLIVVRLGRPIFDVPFGAPLGLPESIILTVGVAAVPCACIGALFPLMVRVARAKPSLIYGGEAAGALAAGLLFVFLFVTRLSPMTIALIAGAIAAAAAAFLIGQSKPVPRPAVGALAMIAIAAALGAVFGGRMDLALERQRWRGQLRDHELLAVSESPYGRYALLESAGQVSLYLDGQLQCDLPDPHASGWFAHTTLLQHPAPQSVLVIGNALNGNVRHALLHGPEHVDVVEYDPVPQRALKDHLPSGALDELDSPAVRVHYTDPAGFLNSSTERYDAILLDIPDPTTLGISRLYSRRFMEACAAHLAEGGVFTIGISSQANYLGPILRQRNALIYHTVRNVWPDAIAAPGDYCLIVARKGDGQLPPGDGARSTLTLDTDELARRLSERGVDAPTYLALLYSDPFPVDRIIAINNSLAAWPAPPPPPEVAVTELLDANADHVALPRLNESAQVDTELQPRAYWLTRLLNTQKHEAAWMLSVVAAAPAAVRWALSTVAAIVILSLLIIRTGQPDRTRSDATPAGLTLASATFAFAIMTMHVVVVLWYQCRVGQMYIGLALLTATFMAGMSVGAVSGSALPRPRRWLMAVQAVVMLASLLLPLMWVSTGAVSVRLAAPICTGLLGAMLGGHFAWCCVIWPNAQASRAGAARWLYAADLIGGALAALVIAAVVVPAHGLAAAAIWAGVFGAASLLAIALLTSPEQRQSAA